MISTALCIAGVLTAVACGILLFSIYGVYYIGLDTEVMKTESILTLLLVNFIFYYLTTWIMRRINEYDF